MSDELHDDKVGMKTDDDGLIVNEDGSYPAKGTQQDRINTLTRNWRSTERALEASNKELSDTKQAMKETGDYVKKLTDSVENLTKKQTAEVLNSEVSRLEEEISGIEDEINEATDNEDWKKVTSLNSKIRKAERKLIIAQNKPVDINALKEDLKNEFGSKKPADGDSEDVDAKIAISDFKRNNAWYTEDDRMRRYADNLAFELVGTGKYKTYDAIMSDVKKMTEKAFDIKPVTNHNNVDNGSYGNYDTGIGDIELSDNDKRLAFNMGIDPKDFLKSKKIIAGRK